MSTTKPTIVDIQYPTFPKWEPGTQGDGSETEKYRHLTAPLLRGVGIDIASQGACVVPWAFSMDLPEEEFLHYSSGNPPKGPIHIRGHGDNIPLDSRSLDFVYSSHLLEDYLDWTPCLREWVRLLKPGGTLVVLIPEKGLWDEAIAGGQPPNCAHNHEGRVGELSSYANDLGLDVVKDELTNCYPGDYTIIFVATKK